MTAHDAATAIGYGDRPPTLRVIEWRPLPLPKNSLRGFVTVEFMPLGLRVVDYPVLVSAGRPWCALPGKPQIDTNGRQKTDAAGKPLYAAMAQWRSRELSDRFSTTVVSAIRRAYPDALDGVGSP